MNSTTKKSPNTKFSPLTNGIIKQLVDIVGCANVITSDNASFEDYGRDETEDLFFRPDIVLKPSTPEEIARILKICNQENIAVTPRGAGTGLSGGALPVCAGVVLSTEKFNKILKIDERNLQAVVEPGVITQVLQDAVQEKDLFYPPDPSSRGTCFIGGNIAENAGGPKAVKYGVVKDYVLNLEIVTPTGDIIWTGANVLKNSTGYNLTQLMVGSEGTLGIITKAVLKLIPFPSHDLSMLVPFYSTEEACNAVSAIFSAGITPSGLEFMERDAIDWTLDYLGDVNLQVEDAVQAHLLIEVDGNDIDVLYKDCEKIYGVLEQFQCGEVLFADSAQQKEDLWKLRRNVAHAVKGNSVYKEEDTVVPRAELAKLLKCVKEIGAEYGFKSVCYGHAGDGNLHVNIVKGDMSDEDWNNRLPEGIRKIFEFTALLGGTISGEHGVGYVQRKYMDTVFNEAQMEIMRGIKNVFDPNGILNPEKIF